jgi:hypothetical protein
VTSATRPSIRLISADSFTVAPWRHNSSVRPALERRIGARPARQVRAQRRGASRSSGQERVAGQL